MYRKHDSLVPKPNHECNICNYTFSIKEILAMHMHKENNGVAPAQKSCNMCLFTSHLSPVIKNHIDRKHLGNLKTFKGNKCDFSAQSKGVLHEHLKHKKATLTWELCDYRTSNAQYLKSPVHALCETDYSWNICGFRFHGLFVRVFSLTDPLKLWLFYKHLHCWIVH